MLKMLLLAVVCLAPVAAHAEDDIEKLKTEYYDWRSGCRQGEMDGKELTSDEAQKACQHLTPIAEKLRKAGLCWDSGEVEWAQCPAIN